MQRKQAVSPAKPKTPRPKGGPQGANQGGASRGGSRVEPSHLKRQARADRARDASPSRRSAKH